MAHDYEQAKANAQMVLAKLRPSDLDNLLKKLKITVPDIPNRNRRREAMVLIISAKIFDEERVVIPRRPPNRCWRHWELEGMANTVHWARHKTTEGVLAQLECQIDNFMSVNPVTRLLVGIRSGRRARRVCLQRWGVTNKSGYFNRGYTGMRLIYRDDCTRACQHDQRYERVRGFETALFKIMKERYHDVWDHTVTDAEGGRAKKSTHRYFLYFVYKL